MESQKQQDLGQTSWVAALNQTFSSEHLSLGLFAHIFHRLTFCVSRTSHGYVLSRYSLGLDSLGGKQTAIRNSKRTRRID